MSALNPDRDIQCPQCGATVPEIENECPSCGFSMSGEAVKHNPDQVNAGTFIEQANQDLVEAGAKAAESAFGIGCWLGALLTLGVVAVLFLAGLRNPIIFALAMLAAVMVSSGVSMLLASQARSANIAGAFRRDVAPSIDAYLGSHNFTRSEFKAMLAATLDRDTPLRTNFSESGLPDRDPNQE